MLFNRHFYFLILSVFFIGIIFWWQTPENAVSAMVKGDQSSNPYTVVGNYWKRMDYRQFDLALEMMSENAKNEHVYLEEILTANPFLSIQSVICDTELKQNEMIVKIIFGSAIDEKKQANYAFKLERIDGDWLISSIKPLF